ncbi:MAG: tetratricopeptide repeat protein [Xanthomonadales bacterium]|nr:tetratricopeptide repeat protein [Xanthomonadales bacterium]
MAASATSQAFTAAQAQQAQQAFGLLQAGHTHEAMAISRRLLTQAAACADAQQLLALCHAQAGDTDAADAAFAQALKLAPMHPMILLNHATMLRKAGRFADALAVLQRTVAALPDFVRAWIELGVSAFHAGDPAQALAALKRAVQLQPSSVLAWYTLGTTAYADGDLQTAQSAFRQVLTLEPAHRDAHFALAAALRLAARPDQAIACYARMAERSGRSPELTDALTGALIEDGKLDQAMAQAQQLVREQPDFVPGHITLGNLLWQHGANAAQGDDPLASLHHAIEQQPEHHALRAALIQMLLTTRAAEPALAQIDIAQRHADNPELTAMRARALDMLGQNEQASALYAQLYRGWGKTQPAFLNAYTRHLLRTGKHDLAAQVATAVTQIEPTNPEAWAYLATAWRLLNDPREAWLCDYDRLITLVDVQPPDGYDSSADFLAALNASLAPLHTARREPMQQSLRGGSQTPGRLFGRPDPVLMATQSALLRAVETWLASLPDDPRHPFLARKQDSVRIGGSWSVKLWSAGHHANHIHSEGWMSSAFYVALPAAIAAPDAADSLAGCIQFGQPMAELELALPPRRVIRPEAGKLALFPSYMWHGTIPFEDTQPRLTVAFDMTPYAKSSATHQETA